MDDKPGIFRRRNSEHHRYTNRFGLENQGYILSKPTGILLILFEYLTPYGILSWNTEILP